MFKFEFRRRIELSGFEPTNIENFSNYFESSIYLIALSIENIYFEFSFFQKKMHKTMKIFSAISVKFSLSLFSIDFFDFWMKFVRKVELYVGNFTNVFRISFFEIKLSIY
jgi:hypothetical protein